MLVDCPHCDSKVDGIEKGSVRVKDDEYPFPLQYTLVECPVCQSALLGLTELLQIGEDKYAWGALSRVWPEQESHIDSGIPNIARNSLIEAKLCFKGRAYTACAVMCGRTIEGLCKYYDGKTRTLADGLKKLKAGGVIDTRLYEWGEALRTQRNLGAHASDHKIPKEDAQDLLDFSVAICEYVFVLNEKFERFKKRQDKK